MTDFSYVNIHPLLIASACDHYTRVTMEGTRFNKDAPAVGLLFGTENHGILSIMDTTDVLLDLSHGVKFVLSEVEKRTKLWVAVYPGYQLLGWYFFDKTFSNTYLELQSSLTSYLPESIIIQFNPAIGKFNSQQDHIPLTVYKYSTSLQELPYKIASCETEKLAIDEIMDSTPKGDLTPLQVHYLSLHSSIEILEKKIEIIINYLTDVKEGKIKSNPTLLRTANKIMNSLTVHRSEEFEQLFNEEISDSLLINYMATFSKNHQQLLEVVELSNLVLDEKITLM